ncbi:MAG TPA: choice-of-anchor Q domain-containing protein [Gammaproteobacteria bacterium]|nr:choice-of-anchor Q domain-containing protein [Gammaproteobacteria bacterium]
MTNSTITGNTATLQGGGVYARGRASYRELNRTMLSGNSAPIGREASVSYEPNQGRNFSIFGFSGSSSVKGFSPGTTDTVPSQPLSEILDTGLASNDGPTRTQALAKGSPAIDTITDGTCPPPARDQRGVSRPQDGNGVGWACVCDVCFFERQ